MAEHTTCSKGNRFSSSLSDFQEANHNQVIECMNTPLLSLEEAVASVAEFVPEVSDYAATAKVLCRQNAIVTINESAAIYLYTMIKAVLPEAERSPSSSKSICIEKMVSLLEAFLKRSQ